MTLATCPKCGGIFDKDEPWKKVCLSCWQKSGNGWKLRGAGVDLVTASWKHVRAEDLQPPKNRKGEWQWW